MAQSWKFSEFSFVVLFEQCAALPQAEQDQYVSAMAQKAVNGDKLASAFMAGWKVYTTLELTDEERAQLDKLTSAIAKAEKLKTASVAKANGEYGKAMALIPQKTWIEDTEKAKALQAEAENAESVAVQKAQSAFLNSTEVDRAQRATLIGKKANEADKAAKAEAGMTAPRKSSGDTAAKWQRDGVFLCQVAPTLHNGLPDFLYVRGHVLAHKTDTSTPAWHLLTGENGTPVNPTSPTSFQSLCREVQVQHDGSVNEGKNKGKLLDSWKQAVHVTYTLNNPRNADGNKATKLLQPSEFYALVNSHNVDMSLLPQAEQDHWKGIFAELDK